MSLFSALGASAEALETYQRALATVQNNVTNATTAGYARQRQPMSPKLFEPENGLSGGVTAGPRESARSDFAERGVRRQASLFGRFDQLAESLAAVEQVFEADAAGGLPAALGEFFARVSAWTLQPNDLPARQGVLDQASAVARAFNDTGTHLESVAVDLRADVEAITARVNELGGRVRDYNRQVRNDAAAANDPGLDAQVHAALEELADLADINVLRQSNGTFTVLLGGQTALVIGDSLLPVSADLTSAAQVAIRDAAGQDVTGQLAGGRLTGVLEAVNSVIPTLRSDLNSFAEAFADAINAQQAAGIDLAGQSGAPLFTYIAPNAARTLAVTPIVAGELAAASAAAPGGNSNALDLAALGRTPQMQGATFAGFYGMIAARAGGALNTARESRDTQQQLLAQAHALRSDRQGVSLDEEAAQLIQLQRSYQAAARMVTVLDELTQTAIDMLRR